MYLFCSSCCRKIDMRQICSYSASLNKSQKWLIIGLCGRYRKLVPKQLACEFYDIHALHFDGYLMLMQADGFSALVQSSVLGKGVKHRPPPIKLPASSACASSGETNLMYDIVYVMYMHYIILYAHVCMYVYIHEHIINIYYNSHGHTCLFCLSTSKSVQISLSVV